MPTITAAATSELPPTPPPAKAAEPAVAAKPPSSEVSAPSAPATGISEQAIPPLTPIPPISGTPETGGFRIGERQIEGAQDLIHALPTSPIEPAGPVSAPSMTPTPIADVVPTDKQVPPVTTETSPETSNPWNAENVLRSERAALDAQRERYAVKAREQLLAKNPHASEADISQAEQTARMEATKLLVLSNMDDRNDTIPWVAGTPGGLKEFYDHRIKPLQDNDPLKAELLAAYQYAQAIKDRLVATMPPSTYDTWGYNDATQSISERTKLQGLNTKFMDPAERALYDQLAKGTDYNPSSVYLRSSRSPQYRYLPVDTTPSKSEQSSTPSAPTSAAEQKTLKTKEHPKTHAERLQKELKRLEQLKNQDLAAYEEAGGDGEFESLVTQLAIMEAEASLPADE